MWVSRRIILRGNELSLSIKKLSITSYIVMKDKERKRMMGLLCRHKDGTSTIPCFCFRKGAKEEDGSNANVSIGGPDEIRSWSEVQTCQVA